MKQIPFGKPAIGDRERQAVMEVLEGPTLVHGPRAKQFEKEFANWTGAANAVSLSSCTAGLHLFWFDLGLGPGDEVIIPAQTHTATAHAVEYTGAKPVFVDVCPETGNIDIDAIEAAVTDQTRGICIVHFLGVPVDMERVMAIADKYDICVLEDCALAVGTRIHGVHAGLLGHAGCFSFYPVKHLTTAEGGMLISNDSKLTERIERKKAFGVDRFLGQRKIPGIYDVAMLGYNYRMNEIQAAIGCEQIRRADGFLGDRESNFKCLFGLLSNLPELSLLGHIDRPGFTCSRYCLSVVLLPDIPKDRFDIVNELTAKGIGTSVYYPAPVPDLTYYRDKYGMGNYPVARQISQRSIALPVGPHLDENDMVYIASALKEALI